MVLITWGVGDGYTGLTSVEVLSPSGVLLPCTVLPRPTSRSHESMSGHTQDGEVACGGGEYATGTSCSTLTGSGWTTSHQLQQWRYDHSSWSSPAGLLLMGGRSSPTTTELLTDTGSSLASFYLEYSTM